MDFVDRERELAALEQLWIEAEREAQLVVVYGRRRIGKTALLRRFTQGKPTVFWTAERTSAARLLGGLSRALWRYAHPDLPPEADFTFASWEQALQYAAQLARKQRLALIIDEFPYAAEAVPALPSLLQRLWDETLARTHLFLVLCGSSISMMEQQVLGYRAPLYGRRTGQLLLRPLTFADARRFFPAYSPVQQVTAWAILGGMPAYLRQFSDRRPIMVNIRERILEPSSFLYYEPRFLVYAELREPRTSLAILEALATGHHRPSDIARVTGLERGLVSRTLSTLRDLHLVEREVPVTEPYPHKSRKGRYRISDAFLRFWFRFVWPFQDRLDVGETAAAEEALREQLPAFVGHAFERLSQEWLRHQGAAGRLPFEPDRIGEWWDRQGQVDVVALNWAERVILLGEAKWLNRPVGLEVLESLKRRGNRAVPDPSWTVHYILFSRSGFTTELRRRAESERLMLVSLEEMVT